jgi:hypothetical protein
MLGLKAVALLCSALSICCLALTGVAQALPEFLAGGKPITTIKFTTKAGSGAIRTSGGNLTWTGASAKGSFEAPNKIAKVVLTFTGDKLGGCEVNSPGAKKGEVISKELKGSIGYINKAIPTVGALFEPATGTTFGEIEKSTCLPSPPTVTGSVIGKISPLNVETTSGEIAFGMVEKKQEVKKFEGELIEHQLSIGELPGVFECKEALTAIEKIEIKA